MKWKNWTFTAGIAIVLLQLFSGCSAPPPTVEELRARSKIAPTTQALEDMEIGMQAECFMSDGTKLDGSFMGYAPPRSDSLLAWVGNASPPPCPGRTALATGDSVVIRRSGGEILTGSFLSADRNGVRVRVDGGRELKYAPYLTIESIAWCGRQTLRPPYDVHYENGKMARIDAVRLHTAERAEVLRSDHIDSIRYHDMPSDHRVAYTVLGLGLGTVVALAVISGSKKRYVEPGSCTSGCPYLFGWSGEEWRMETECFTGSVFRAAQRRDWARLEYTAPHDGILCLRLKNLMHEIDSIDHLALLRVEHDASTEVFPTEDGRLLPVKAQLPLRARDDRNRDILPLLDGSDEQCWLALPRAEGSEGSTRRWMECEFPRPAEGDSVTLMLRVKNTDWGARMHYAFFSMFGDGLQRQYEEWNTDSAARASLHGVMLREGMLAVSLWDGSAWRNAGHVWEVGIGEYRAVALRVDISGVRSDVLRLRFEAPAAIWMVGSVDLSADPPEGVQVRRIPPSAVRRDERSGGSGTRSDGSGSDCRQQLESEDGDYLVLDTGESADVEFRIPSDALPAGRAVTWIVESSGYYRMKLESSQPPDADLLRRLFTEPGFFASYSDAEFRRAIEQHAERQHAEQQQAEK